MKLGDIVLVRFPQDNLKVRKSFLFLYKLIVET